MSDETSYEEFAAQTMKHARQYAHQLRLMVIGAHAIVATGGDMLRVVDTLNCFASDYDNWLAFREQALATLADRAPEPQPQVH